MNHDFAKFWLGQAISNLGTSFTQFALPLLVFKLTGSAVNLAITTAATFLPYLLFGLVVGAWVDRVDRKRLMIGTDIARALVIASIPALSAVDRLSVEWIYVVTFVSTTLSLCFGAAEFAALPSLVNDTSGEDMVTANGRIQASYSAASILGPLLAGALAALVSIPLLLLVDAASFLVSALSLALIDISFNQPTQEPKRTNIRQDIVEGLRYVLSHPVLRNISAMMALVNLIGSTVATQLVLFGKERLHATDSQIAILYAADSVGVMLLSLAAGPLRKRWRFSTVALGALMLSGLLTIVFAAVPWYWVAVPLWAVISGLGTLFNINTGSLRQAIVPNHLLGRVISVAMVLAWSAVPLGAFVGGLAIEWTNDVALVYGVIGVLTMLIPLAFWFTPLGHAERYISPAEPELATTA
ncbi:MAG TPA: MFS transporter [Chloroflexota bacterium]|jgi:MFS family permease|nr:MFS transporter [Chloroflexota bacterium]